MPLVILLIAGALAVWATTREATRSDQAQRFVTQLCRDIAADRDATGRTNLSDAFAERRIVEAIKAVCPSPDSMSSLDVTIRPGDVSEDGTFLRKATHTAILARDGVELLGLRILHEGDENDILILGYWTPASDS